MCSLNCAGSLYDHIGDDVRVRDGNGVRSVDLDNGRLRPLGFELLSGWTQAFAC
jgi:hypothetical protein